jgi:hypothetical protein
MIIFPHVPKTAGSSLRRSLSEKYGDRLFLDYDTAPVSDSPKRLLLEQEQKEQIASNTMLWRDNYDIIYGHYPADKYDSLGPDIKRAIFFRDPIDRTCSNYFYRLHNQTSGSGDISNVPISEFAMRPNMRFVYSNYLRNISISDFDFIGITERFEESLDLFEKVFGIKLDSHRERVGKNNNYSNYLKDDGSLEILEQSQAHNQKIYEKALRAFDRLYSKHVG